MLGEETKGGELDVWAAEIAISQLAVKVESDELIGAGDF